MKNETAASLSFLLESLRLLPVSSSTFMMTGKCAYLGAFQPKVSNNST